MRQEQHELNRPQMAAVVSDGSWAGTLDVPTPSGPTRVRRQPRKAHALRHLGEMIVAMLLGMAVLGMATDVALNAAGLDYDRPPLAWPEVSALIMAFNMSVPMVWWMRHRGHSWPYAMEMAAAMFVPVVALLPVLWLGLISGDGLLIIQHAVMIPSMVVVMHRRRRELAH